MKNVIVIPTLRENTPQPTPKEPVNYKGLIEGRSITISNTGHPVKFDGDRIKDISIKDGQVKIFIEKVAMNDDKSIYRSNGMFLTFNENSPKIAFDSGNIILSNTDPKNDLLSVTQENFIKLNIT